MNLSNITISRPVATVMILLIVIVLGFYSVMTIPMDLMPKIELPIALVMTQYSNSSPEEVESMVTKTLESVLASCEGVESMVSYSLEGTSVVMLNFTTKTDMNFATLDMREKIALVEDYLPDECTKPMVMKMSMDSMPVSQIYISSDQYTLAELNQKIEDNVVPYLERASGVASVSVSGGVSKEVVLEFNQSQLAAYGMSLSVISQLLSAENLNLPSGNITKGDSEVIVRTVGKFASVSDIENLPLTISDRSVVRLGDIASVTMGFSEQKDITRIDGKTAIGVSITKASDANTVETSDHINTILNQLRDKYPEMTFTVGYDQADYIKSSIKSVAESAIVGGLLAVVIVFMFLRNLRTTGIIAISIPTSLLATFFAMKLIGITLNIVTLCSLTIVVGMLVDNSIVVLENIYRRRQEMDDAAEAASKGSGEIFLAITASTLTTVCVFLPIAVSGGIAGMMFKEFCWTIIVALAASLIVATTVIPMLCSIVMRGTVHTEYIRFGNRRYKYKLVNRFGDFITNLQDVYEGAVRNVLKKRKRFMVGAIALFLVSLILVLMLPFELLPATDEGQIDISVGFPYGTSLESKDRVLSQIEAEVLALPELEHASLSTGSSSALSTSDNSSVSVVLVGRNDRDRTSEEIADMLREKFNKITEADVSVQSSSSVSGMMGGSGTSFMIKGQERETLEKIGYDLIDVCKQVEGVKDAYLSVEDGNPEVMVVIDRVTASYYGINSYQLANAIQTAINGTSTTSLTVDGEDISVKLKLASGGADSIESLKQVVVTGSYGLSAPVGEIAKLVTANAPSAIYRNNQTNYITLNVDVDGTSATGGASAVARVVNNYQFPDGYFVETSGSYQSMVEAFTALFQALMIAIALVFLLLAAQFESVTMSFIVMMAVPFAMTGAFLALFLAGSSICMTSFLGLIILVGTVVNNSILLVEFIRQNEGEIGTREAIVQAGKLRLRPILMSATTTIVGMIPMSLGLGEGGEMMAPMAISIIGGLIASTVITLFLIPIIYSMIDERRQKNNTKKEEKRRHTEELEAKWREEDLALE